MKGSTMDIIIVKFGEVFTVHKGEHFKHFRVEAGGILVVCPGGIADDIVLKKSSMLLYYEDSTIEVNGGLDGITVFIPKPHPRRRTLRHPHNN